MVRHLIPEVPDLVDLGMELGNCVVALNVRQVGPKILPPQLPVEDAGKDVDPETESEIPYKVVGNTAVSGMDSLSCMPARTTIYVTHVLLETPAGDGWAPTDTDEGGGLTGAAPSSFSGAASPGLRFPFAHAPTADGQPVLQAVPAIAFSGYTTSYESKQYLFEILAVWHGFQQNME
jgi:hypothetical protein